VKRGVGALAWGRALGLRNAAREEVSRRSAVYFVTFRRAPAPDPASTARIRALSEKTMPQQSGSTSSETRSPAVRVHILGAGPVGLLLTALLQPSESFAVHLYEKRRDYTRSRMVQLAPYLVADSVADYSTDYIDEESVFAIFDPREIDEGLAFRRSIPSDLMALLRGWTQGFCPLNEIERSLSDLIDGRQLQPVQRTTANISAQEAMAMLAPGDILIDCTGSRSVLRDQLTPNAGATDAPVSLVLLPKETDARRTKTRPNDHVTDSANTLQIRLEYALVITFLYGQPYDCNERCKYAKNIDNPQYKFIPAVNRTYYDGRISHVTGIITISAEDYERMPSRFDGHWLRDNFPQVAESMDRFIAKVKAETNGELMGDLEIIRIPLDLYRARNATSREWRRVKTGDQPLSRSPVFLAGDSAMGSPYFQSISLGFECAMFLAGLLGQRDVPLAEMFDRYELYIYKQWLRVYNRSKMIKHNKDLLASIGDTDALLEKLHIY
jgi:2-polyprenyl-6-methoxyphenol hydroxylase-like FAD-dependent oxidoreductase